MLNTLLINPSNPVQGSHWPSLGLLYLAAALDQNGYGVRVHDECLGDPLDSNYDPQLIGITCTTPNFMAVRDLIGKCRAYWPTAKIIVGGPHISAVPGDTAVLGADAGCIGDGEEAILVAARSVERGWTFERTYFTPGYRTNANAYPITARKFVPLERYTARLDGTPMTSLIASRGCPFNCAFCNHIPGYRNVSYRRISNILDELYSLRDQFPAVMFMDDEVNLNEAELLNLCEAMRPLKMRFQCHVRADLFTELQAEALAKAGCAEIRVGVESGSDLILRNVEKRTTVDDNTRARRIAKAFDIRFVAFMLLGLPGESPETVRASKRWLMENKPDFYSAFTFQPFPGTPIYEHPEKFDIQFPKPLPYDRMSLGIRGRDGEAAPCLVSTSKMSSQEIANAVRYFDVELREEVHG